MNQIALPSSTMGRKLTIWLVLPLIVVTTVWAIVTYGPSGTPAIAPGAFKTYTLTTKDIPVKINKDGELQAVNNIEIVSEVEGQTTIQTILPEGATVKKDDIILTLDSSTIKQRIEDTTLEIQRAENELTTSREMKDIQESQNAANLEAANVQLLLAQLDLKQYVEGTYPQQLKNAQTDLDMAQINLRTMEEKLGQTKTLFLKNFVTQTAIKDDELAVTTAKNNLAKAEQALRVLKEYTNQMDMASKDNAVSQARQGLIRTERQNASNLAQRIGDVNQKTQSLELLRRRLQRYEEQLLSCTIRATADGLVVYASSGSNERFSQQTPIQEGATVREQQRLIRLPDTSTMKVVVRINEAMVGRLYEGQRARVRIVGVPNYIWATLTKISVLADSGQRQFNPDVKEYPIDLTLDETPPGLKPGMGAAAEVFVDLAENALAVPLASIYSAGQDAYVFARENDQFLPRKIRVGRTDDAYAEALGDTIKNGDEVLLLAFGQGQELLERAGIKVAPTSQPTDGFGRRGRGGGRRGGNGNGGGGMGPNGNGNGDGVAQVENADGAPPAGDMPPEGGRRGRGRGRRGGGGGQGPGMGPGPDGQPPTPPPVN